MGEKINFEEMEKENEELMNNCYLLEEKNKAIKEHNKSLKESLIEKLEKAQGLF